MKSLLVPQSLLGCVLAVVLVATTFYSRPALAQNNGSFGQGNNVGGVKIDPHGALTNFDVQSRALDLKALRERIGKPGAELARSVEMRMISLRGLEAALAHAIATKQDSLPDDVRFLGGLQRITHVFVFPEQNDIVLAGPGEGWKVRDDATVVGVTTDLPVIQLDDLLVALRTAQGARATSISCSIDPSAEGRRAFDKFASQQPKFTPQVLKQLQQAMGPQPITLTGVPADSHLARVLVAADYRMKRIAMGLEPSPLKSLPSYLEMIKKGSAESSTPRWWLACNYESLAKTEDGLSWELRGPGVKCMTENDLVDDQGKVQNSGEKSPVADAWASLMTRHYGELSAKDSIFGDLRNVMDLCVIAALIEKEGLLAKADLQIPTLMSSDSQLKTQAWPAPKSVATQCSFLRSNRGVIVTASGGVEITSWQVASQSQTSDALQAVRVKTAAPTGKSWWAN